MLTNGQAIGTIVLFAQKNFKERPVRMLLARAFGDRQHFVHLGMRVTIAWLNRDPYLIDVSETDAPDTIIEDRHGSS